MPKYKVTVSRGVDETGIFDIEASNEQEAIQAAINAGADIGFDVWEVDSVEVVDE